MEQCHQPERIQEGDESAEHGYNVLKAGVTFKTVDDRGQEVEIEFEDPSDVEENNEVELNGDAIDEDDAVVDAEAGDDVPVHVVLVADEFEESNKESEEENQFAVKTEDSETTIIDIEKSTADGNIVVIKSDVQAVSLVYLCPVDKCKSRFSSKEHFMKHMESSHDLQDPLENSEESESNLVISEDNENQQILECMNCEFSTESVEKMEEHLQNEMDLEENEEESSSIIIHLNPSTNKSYTCPKCDISFQKKFYLVRHMKTVHREGNSPLFKCITCTFQTKNHQELRKHSSRCNVKVEKKVADIYSESSVEAGNVYKCVCTWCEYKSNKYSHVKKHIEIYHEQTSHYPCKECVFIGKTVDDYATHYNSFHKTDDYKHACTDCSFKCTNRTDMRNHYVDVHKKQRLYACKLCMYRAQDVMTIKKHISKTHSTFIFHCKDCDFSSNKKYEFSRHCSQVHGESCFKMTSEMFGHTIGQEVQEIVEKVRDHGEPVPETDIMEEQIFEEEILEEQIEEEVISDFYEGSVMLLS